MTLAHIDDLVKQVGDPQLRAALAQQVATLTSRKQFGLVFQEHSPESVRLPQQRIRTGDKVQLRESKESATFHVIATKASLDVATVVELDESGETLGEPQDILKADLVVVKPFGDPVYPGLRQVGEAGSAKPGQPTHVVINGENFHALQALEYTHAGKVDLIYIDPPYNTGNDTWKYNDRYIDGQDVYRHSKWLSFMEKRLKAAKKLLRPTGVLIMAIDDSEHARLKMLADQVMGESNFLVNLVWQGGMKNNGKFTGGGVDYMLVYAANSESYINSGVIWQEPKVGLDLLLEAGKKAWEESGGDKVKARDIFAAKKKVLSLKKLGVSESTIANYSHIDDVRPGEVYYACNMSAPDNPDKRSHRPLIHPITNLPCMVPAAGWASTDKTMDYLLENGLIHFGPDETVQPRKKTYLRETAFGAPKPTFTSNRKIGSEHLERMFGDKRFPFPKDHSVLMRWFRMSAPKDAVIVDFFAGSGTTAESVIRLNEEDGGTRQAILVTNNELSKSEDAALRKNGFHPGDAEYEAMGVFHHVTKPRISTVLTGVRHDGSTYSDGIDGQSAAFFDLTYEDENLVSLGNRFEAIAPLLWLQSGATGELIAKRSDLDKGEEGYVVPEDGNYAVIFDTEAAADAIEALHDGIKKVFIVTDSENDFKAVTANLPGDLKNTAQRLYSSYLRSFEINRG